MLHADYSNKAALGPLVWQLYRTVQQGTLKDSVDNRLKRPAVFAILEAARCNVTRPERLYNFQGAHRSIAFHWFAWFCLRSFKQNKWALQGLSRSKWPLSWAAGPSNGALTDPKTETPIINRHGEKGVLYQTSQNLPKTSKHLQTFQKTSKNLPNNFPKPTKNLPKNIPKTSSWRKRSAQAPWSWAMWLSFGHSRPTSRRLQRRGKVMEGFFRFST